MSLPRSTHDAPKSGKNKNSPDFVLVSATPERLAKARGLGADAVEDVVTDGRMATRLLDGDVLELLLRRGVITAGQHAAGNQFRWHWERSGIAAGGAVDLERERVDGGQHKPVSDAALHHHAEWQRMVRGLGQVHSQILCDVVLRGASLSDWGLWQRGTRNAKLAGEWAQGRFVAALEQLELIVAGKRHNPLRVFSPVSARPTLSTASSTPPSPVDDAS